MELYRRRQDFMNAEGSLSRQIKRIVARGTGKPKVSDEDVRDATALFSQVAPLLSLRDNARRLKLQEEKILTRIVKQLPIWTAFGESITGLGAVSLGAIISEAGDISRFSNPAKLWKRMGLAIVGGERQRKCKDKDKAIEHGYSPRRRSVMFIIGDNLMKLNKGEYRTVYDQRKAYEIAKAESLGLTVRPAARIPKGEHEKYRSEGHIHLRAKRYMEKRLLRNLWRAWRDQVGADTQIGLVQSSPPQSLKAA